MAGYLRGLLNANTTDLWIWMWIYPISMPWMTHWKIWSVRSTSISSSPFKNPHPLWGLRVYSQTKSNRRRPLMAILESLKETILSMSIEILETRQEWASGKFAKHERSMVGRRVKSGNAVVREETSVFQSRSEAVIVRKLRREIVGRKFERADDRHGRRSYAPYGLLHTWDWVCGYSRQLLVFPWRIPSLKMPGGELGLLISQEKTKIRISSVFKELALISNSFLRICIKHRRISWRWYEWIKGKDLRHWVMLNVVGNAPAA